MRCRAGLMAAVTIAALIAVPVSAGADPAQETSAAQAVAWLEAKTLPSGLVPTSADFGDVTITLDSILAAAAADAPAAAERWVEGITPLLAERVSFDVGALGKALVALDAAGRDVTDFNGLNLRTLALESLAQGAEPGWATSAEAPEGANAFGQSLIMIGLARTGELPAAAVDFLVSKQCDGGGFPMFFKAGEGCGSSTQDPDGTALAIMALRAARVACNPTAEAALSRAVEWLGAQQRPNGSFLGAAPWTAVENTNSTGVIAGALTRLSHAGATDAAAAWVAAMQIPEGQPEAGSISYDEPNRVADPEVAQWQRIRATPQAVLALTRDSYHSVQLANSASAGAPQPCAALELTSLGLPPTGN